MRETEVIDKIPGDEVFVAQSEDRMSVVYRSYDTDGSVLGSAVYRILKGRLRLYDADGNVIEEHDCDPPADWYQTPPRIADYF